MRECAEPTDARGLCREHYNRWHNAFKRLSASERPDPKTMPASFWERVRAKRGLVCRGCGEPHHALEICRIGYDRYLRLPEPRPVPATLPADFCSLKDCIVCGRPFQRADAGELCQLHRRKLAYHFPDPGTRPDPATLPADFWEDKRKKR